MKLNHLIIIGALCGALLIPTSAQTWGVIGLSGSGGGGEPEAKNIAYVNSSYGRATGSGTTIASTASSATTGNMLVVFVGSDYASSATVSGIADTASNTYTYIGRVTRSEMSLECWYAKNITGNASNTVTATFTGAVSYRRIIVGQYSGLNTTAPYDTSNSGSGNSATSLTTTASNSTDAEAVIVACYYLYDQTRTFTAGSTSQAFTLRGTSTDGDIQLEDAILSTSGSKSSSITISTATGWLGFHAIFK